MLAESERQSGGSHRHDHCALLNLDSIQCGFQPSEDAFPLSRSHPSTSRLRHYSVAFTFQNQLCPVEDPGEGLSSSRFLSLLDPRPTRTLSTPNVMLTAWWRDHSRVHLLSLSLAQLFF